MIATALPQSSAPAPTGTVTGLPYPNWTTPQQFAADLLAELTGSKNAAQANPNSAAFISSWEGAEGGNWANSAQFNPLNTSLPEAGSVNYNTGKAGSGVQAYPSPLEGLQATVDTLTQGNNYTTLVNDLVNNAPESATNAALVASPWDANHYNGVGVLGGNVTLTSAQKSSGTSSGSSSSQQTQTVSSQTAQSGSLFGKMLADLDGLLNYGGIFSTSGVLNPASSVRVVLARSAFAVAGGVMIIAGLYLTVKTIGNGIDDVAKNVPGGKAVTGAAKGLAKAGAAAAVMA